jgi:hypothetical protein
MLTGCFAVFVVWSAEMFDIWNGQRNYAWRNLFAFSSIKQLRIFTVCGLPYALISLNLLSSKAIWLPTRALFWISAISELHTVKAFNLPRFSKSHPLLIQCCYRRKPKLNYNFIYTGYFKQFVCHIRTA